VVDVEVLGHGDCFAGEFAHSPVDGLSHGSGSSLPNSNLCRTFEKKMRVK
jgi:hypothetical protein